MAILGVVILMYIAYFIDQKMGASKGEHRQPLFGAYVIMSESMIPNINVYDAVVTVRVGQDKLKINDIITFISKEIETGGTPITHRIIGIVDTETGIKYRTKGDHNNTEDFALISPEEVIGKVYLRVPMVGYVQTFMTRPIGWLLVVVIPCLLIIGSDIVKLVKKTSSKEEDSGESEQESYISFTNRDSISISVTDTLEGSEEVISSPDVENQNHKIESLELDDDEKII